MDIKLLKSDILSNNIPNILIFYEEEPAIAKQYLKSMEDTLQKPVRLYDSIDEIIYDVTTNIKEDFIYVVMDDKTLLKNDAYMSNLPTYGRNIILRFSKPEKPNDALSKFLDKYSQYVVEFNKQDLYTLLAYCEKMCKKNKVNIDQDKLITLIERCDCNLGILLNELDKIFTLGQENSNLLMDYMLNKGFSDYRKINTTNFVNRILNGDKSVLKDVVMIDDSPVSLSLYMYTIARNRLCKDTRNYFMAKVMKECSNIYNGVVSGTIGNDYSLKYMLLRIFEDI